MVAGLSLRAGDSLFYGLLWRANNSPNHVVATALKNVRVSLVRRY